MTEEQKAIINFMGSVYGDAKKIDGNMVAQSSTLKPTSQVVEKVIREQLASSEVPVLPPTQEELRLTGISDEPPPQIGEPVPPRPVVDIPMHVGPVVNVPVNANVGQAVDTFAFDILQKLNTIINELQKLNNIIGHEIEDNEG